MQQHALASAALDCVDRMEIEAFMALLHDRVCFRFGNAEPVVGKSNLKPVLEGFFAALAGIAHQLEQVWQVDHELICHGRVCYTRHDGSELSVPFANLFRLEDGLIRDYLIFVDSSQLFAQPA